MPTFQLGPDGAGTLGGAVNATGYIGSSTVATNLSIPGATYSFNSGIGNTEPRRSGPQRAHLRLETAIRSQRREIRIRGSGKRS